MPTATDIDLEELFRLGEDLQEQCEHSQHNHPKGRTEWGHSDDSGLSYVFVGACSDADRGPAVIRMFCNSFIARAFSSDFYKCIDCGNPLRDHYTVLGPVE